MLFEEVLTRVGGSYDTARAHRLLALPIDGIPLAKRKNELRKPGSNFYSQEFLEALAVARMLVDLDMDSAIRNIARRDRPDICVDYASGQKLYVEHTNVSEFDGMPFGRHLEDVNNAIAEYRASDADFDQFCASGNFTLRLTDPGLQNRSDPNAIALESAGLTATINRSGQLHNPDPLAHPVLARYAAQAFYFHGRTSNPAPATQAGGWFDPSPPWVAFRLREALEKKRGRARLFDPTLHPLWLLITLDAERDLFPPFVVPLIRNGLRDAQIDPYERVVVTCPGVTPVCRGASDS